jgi:hypothetical protein
MLAEGINVVLQNEADFLCRLFFTVISQEGVIAWDL